MGKDKSGLMPADPVEMGYERRAHTLPHRPKNTEHNYKPTTVN